MRKTKIICTLGPTTVGIIDKLVENGMNVARINFSHESHDIHAERLRELKSVCAKAEKHIPVMMDTKGPEIRIGTVAGKVTLEKGQRFVLFNDGREGSVNGVSISHEHLYKTVSKNDLIYIDDGKICLEVESIDGEAIVCIIRSGGPLSSRKGVNVPGKKTGLPFLSQKDKGDIQFAVNLGIDYIALSFIASADDVRTAREFIKNTGQTHVKIISKIENSHAVDDIDAIIDESDGIMVARGDLGIEMKMAEVPGIQKKLIRSCYLSGKPVITATQMLDSMSENPVPTRAEVSDVANAIYDSTSAVMLSGETAMSQYPIQALQTMVEIIETTEKNIDYKKQFFAETWFTENNVSEALGQAAAVMAFKLEAQAIIVITRTGRSARSISRFRPDIPIIALAVDANVTRQLGLSWGITPEFTEFIHDAGDLFKNMVDHAKKTGIVSEGDLVIITAGLPTGATGRTNMLKVHTIGDPVI